MKIAALTMTYRDYWALEQWYRHFAGLLVAENLYIVVHGPDDSIAARCPGAKILHVPRDDLSHFDKRRAGLLNGIAAGLRHLYTWVIRTDVDELICYDPAKPLGAQRRSVWFSGHYSKAFAISGEVDLWRHGVKVRDRPFREFPFEMPEGLYLVHLKHANLATTQAVDDIRKSVANAGQHSASGLPGEAWINAHDDTQKLLEQHYARRPTSWRICESEAYVELSKNPRKFRKIGLLKARSFKFDTRTEMPDWLAEQLAPFTKD